jgi:DNA-3-methyladenine glycosylase II
MLSSHAAKTIYERVASAARKHGHKGSWQLDSTMLRECGVSGSKARTIAEFGAAYDREPGRYEGWCKLTVDDLFSEVRACWGMSDWSASMLGIFYFAHEDIFPHSDGSIQRAAELLRKAGYIRGRSKRAFVPEVAAPYRSYLALYMWRMLDEKVLTSKR